MTTNSIEPDDFLPAKKHIAVSSGESVRIIREMQELTQDELAELVNMPTAVLEAIEADQLELSTANAELLAHALKIHPAVLLDSHIETVPQSS